MDSQHSPGEPVGVSIAKRGCHTTFQMKELAEQLVNLIANADTRLREVDEAAAAAKPHQRCGQKRKCWAT